MDAIVADVNVLRTTPSVSTKSRAIDMDKIEKTAKDFESVFMAQMLKPMWDGVETDGMFGGGAGEDAMRDLLVQEYGKAMVRNDQHGLSPAIMDAMIRMQEQADGASVGG